MSTSETCRAIGRAAIPVAAVVGLALARVPPSEAETGKGGRATIAASNNQFAFDLYARLQAEKGNLLYSPLSITAALGMAVAGARGQTASEIKAGLRFGPLGPALHDGIGRLMKELGAKDEGLQLAIANALWIRKGLALDRKYLARMKASYGAGPREVDYGKDPERARKTINAWVEEQTQKKIVELLIPSDVTEGTRLVLTNAIYLKGLWAQKFDPADTKPGPFWIAPKRSVETSLMRLRGKTFAYKKGDGFSLLELPYRGGKASMVIVLPDAKDGLSALEKKLMTGSPSALFADASPTPLAEVALPRFKASYRVDLVARLKALGIQAAFTDGADFSGITPKEPLKISKVIHQASVEVNEEGTEAAAATAVVVAPGGAPPSQKKFIADHPFLFFIRDNTKGALLFAGRLVDPVASSGEPRSIGSATMMANGAIRLLLRAESPKGDVGDAQLFYPKGHKEYEKILKHLGGLKPGETKPVPPFPR